MSHELRTPLNSIIGFTGVLLQGKAGPLNEEQVKQLSLVREGGNQLLSIVNDIIDISRIEAGDPAVVREPFSMREVVETAFQGRARRRPDRPGSQSRRSRGRLVAGQSNPPPGESQGIQQ